MKLSNLVKSLGLASALVFSSLSFAADIGINANANDVAIHGYDPVSYFTMQKPTMGKSMYSATYKGAIYQFSSEENRDRFRANPAAYAPQFGGFCAMGVALNKKFDVDPTAWYIKGDKLYLNLNKAVQQKWMEDVPGNLKTAYRNWNGIEAVSADELADE
ncbi:YHS domain-containing (seleno)protein [Neptunicella marina]|uniref:YHS domain-containing protein n=1 Tax=Neptunicella marina TaxID=2125989 RepID=A0A8J6IX79_9ALTE|nr:YHS domain-containing (seleno)protein [Neptunicella marina]MBC3767190.1 YHS domain-containing protein [Neptunicella marina]